MTAIVGLFGDFARDGAAAARRALGAMHARGREHVELWADEGVALGAVSDLWEIGDRGVAARVAWNEEAAVATDATLYYLHDLRAALERAGATESDASPARVILAAYRAWGRECLAHLEGDFAVLLWDRRARALLAARDHTGARPLFYTERPSGLALASRLDGLTNLPGFDRTLNLLAIADDALFLRVQNPEATAYRDARRLPAGHRLEWSAPGAAGVRVARWWDVPIFHRGDGPPFREAVDELRRLIVDAVAERAQHPGGSSIWLSGGYDSSTLFAASHVAGAERGAMIAHPVSMSHPPGDPGREDEYIEATTSFWRVTPTWVAVDDVPALSDPVAGARLRDEPMYHTYEQSNRALAVATRSADRRVALVGNGGDQFFSASVSRLADHFRRLSVLTLAREWREAGGRSDWRLFLKTVVFPNLSPAAIRALERIRGRPLGHELARAVPAWADRSFARFHELDALNRSPLQRRPGEGHAALEQSWFLRQVTGERVNVAYTATGLLDGIELRTPLFDERIIRFAARRPLEESYSRGENKRLLRAAFARDLPPGVLGPRSVRTGLPQRSLFRSSWEHAQWIGGAGKGMILADLGVIDGSKFRERAGRWAVQGGNDVNEAAAIVASVQAECWLRARL